MMKRILSLLLCLCLMLSLVLPALAEQDREAIHLHSVEDLLDLAENCVLDSYSRGKTVYLHKDLDLTGVAFSGIPTFGGTFEGRGHTISGLELTEQRSAAGLFRYVQREGLIRDLTVSGRVAPGGTAATVGGIVGCNRGLLIDCRFEGTVAGSASIGGIAGVNEAGGCILRCVSQGLVVGENMTGGITGYNVGLIEGCDNLACVNIQTPDATLDLSSIDLSVLMDPSMLSAGVTVMDTGGIAGYSIGSIYDCVNSASVGYPHIGYNVGGIAGRSCGAVSGCTNRAAIQGRKDVGGIVGQMEPNLSLNLDEDHLQRLEDQFAELESLIRQVQVSMNDFSAAGTHLNNTVAHIGSASTALEELTGYIGEYGSALTDEFNRTSLLLQDALQQMLPVLEQAVVLGESLELATRSLANAMDAMGDATGYLGQIMALVNDAKGRLDQVGPYTSQAMERFAQGMKLLISALETKDPEQQRTAMALIESGVRDLSVAAQQAGEAFVLIAQVLQQQGDWNEETDAAFIVIGRSLTDAAGALQTMLDGLVALIENLEYDQDSFWAGVDSLRAGMDELDNAMGGLQTAMGDLALVLKALGRTADHTGWALSILAEAMTDTAGSVKELTKFGDLLHTAMEHISHYEPIQLPKLDSGAQKAADVLFDDVNAISDELRSILSLSETFSQETKEQLNAIYETFDQMLSTAMLLVDQVVDTAAGGLIKDTSDADIDAVKAGKVSACVNEGKISGDINAGGVAGAMGIDYQLDPEDDLTGQLSQLRLRTYQAKAIIQDCLNWGVVEGKRSYMGGICGRMDMGILLDTNNFGHVSSAAGDYVGGIAGSAAGPIRRCGVKADLIGGKYVGGVAGVATAVADCRAMVQLTGREFVGAILGHAEDLDSINANFYYSIAGTLGAIDGISYDGHAQNAVWDSFLDSPVTQQYFDHAELTFRFADGTTQVLNLPVGTVLEVGITPQLENTDQNVCFWEGLEQQLGRAQYFNRIFVESRKGKITVLESQQTRPDGKPILLLQGSFLTQEQLQLQPLVDHPEALEGWQFAVPAGGAVTQIRYALPEDMEEVTILVRDQGGILQEVTTSRSGSYVVFALEEGTTAFYVTAATAGGDWAVWTIAAAAAVALVATSVILLGKKRKKAH